MPKVQKFFSVGWHAYKHKHALIPENTEMLMLYLFDVLTGKRGLKVQNSIPK